MRLVGALLSIALLAGACGGNHVSSVYAALDSGGLRTRTEFFTDTESIYCLTEIAGAASGTTVNAEIRQIGAAGVPVDRLLALSEDVVSSSAPSTFAFELTKPASEAAGPWPVGKFECDILLDGVEHGSTQFDILMPQCPVYPVSDGDVCGGYYPVGASCLAVDQTKSCVCTAAGSFSC